MYGRLNKENCFGVELWWSKKKVLEELYFRDGFFIDLYI